MTRAEIETIAQEVAAIMGGNVPALRNGYADIKQANPYEAEFEKGSGIAQEILMQTSDPEGQRALVDGILRTLYANWQEKAKQSEMGVKSWYSLMDYFQRQ